MQLSRRKFIGGGAALACSACTHAGSLDAVPPALPSKGLIDVHHHFVSASRIAFTEMVGSASSYHRWFQGKVPWTVEKALSDMDAAGVSTAILSSMVEGHVGSPDQRRKLARGINEEGAAIVASNAGRFALFASLPVPDVDACLTEIDYAFDHLEAVGVALHSNTGHIWLGHPSLDPIFAALNQRRAVVFVHPDSAACCTNLVQGVIDPIIEFGADTGRAAASLIFNGTTTRFPDVRFILAHAGGVVPFLIERFLVGTEAEIVPGAVTKGVAGSYGVRQPPAGALAELRRMFYDTAQASNPIAMNALKTLVPTSQIVFGTDFWYRSAVETRGNLERSKIFSQEQLQGIGFANIRSIINHF